MRINKYIAACGALSRRKADEAIAAGRVLVNGERAAAVMDISEDDEVMLDNKKITLEKKSYYIALNKPKGYITSASDERKRPTVMDLTEEIGARLFPVGRLDFNTRGLIILTNDGEFANLIAHPRYEIYKTYQAHVKGIVSAAKLSEIRKGIYISGQKTAPARVKIAKIYPKSSLVEISIREGKNRQVRKMFKALGHEVVDLVRVAVGPVLLGNLPEGHWRSLREGEISKLREGALDYDKGGRGGRRQN